MAKKNKPPAFQFYVKDWLTDMDVVRMTASQRGGYIQLLCYQWLDENCVLDNDLDLLKNLAQIDEKDLEKVLKKFEKKGDKLYNKKLFSARKTANEFYKKQQINGSKGGRPRKTPKPKENPTVMVWDNPNDNPDYIPNETPSSSSTSSNKIEKKYKQKKENSNDSFFLPYDELKVVILNQEQWLTNVCRRFNFSRADAEKKVLNFVEDESLKNPGLFRDLHDLQRHFVNWMIIQKEKEKNSAKKEKQNSANNGDIKLEQDHSKYYEGI